MRDDEVTQTSEEEYGLPFVVAPEESLDHNGHHYALDDIENNGVIIGTDPEQNVVKVYYALDEIGERSARLLSRMIFLISTRRL